MLTEVQYNTYMKDNLEVNTVSWKHHDAEDDSNHYENGILYSICIKGKFLSQFFSLSKVLKQPEIDYKAWAIEILTDKIDELFEIEELEDKDFSKGSLELMEEIQKTYIKKLSASDINVITWK